MTFLGSRKWLSSLYDNHYKLLHNVNDFMESDLFLNYTHKNELIYILDFTSEEQFAYNIKKINKAYFLFIPIGVKNINHAFH